MSHVLGTLAPGTGEFLEGQAQAVGTPSSDNGSHGLSGNMAVLQGADSRAMSLRAWTDTFSSTAHPCTHSSASAGQLPGSTAAWKQMALLAHGQAGGAHGHITVPMSSTSLHPIPQASCHPPHHHKNRGGNCHIKLRLNATEIIKNQRWAVIPSPLTK